MKTPFLALSAILLFAASAAAQPPPHELHPKNRTRG